MFFLFPLTARHGLQAMTWPPSYEMASKLQNDVQKHFSKPREIVKMPIEPHNHASKEESPLTEITHTKPLTPFLNLLKPSKPIAPTESSSRGEYAT